MLEELKKLNALLSKGKQVVKAKDLLSILGQGKVKRLIPITPVLAELY